MPITHAQLLEYMQSLSYAIHKAGMCYGFASMAVQAVLAHDVQTYNERLMILEKCGAGELAQKIETIRNKIKNRQTRAQLTHEEEMILSIPAFFDGVAIHFDPRSYPDLFPVVGRPQGQNFEDTLPTVLPQRLMLKETILGEDKQFSTIEKVNVKKAATFSGVYSQVELTTVFKLLRETYLKQHPAEDESLCFMISNGLHVITVAYDQHAQIWQCFNASLSIDVPTDENIAHEVMCCFFAERYANNELSLFIESYCKTAYVEKMNRYFNACQQEEVWKTVHEMTAKKVQPQVIFGCSWLFIAAQFGEHQTVQALLEKGADPNQALKSGITPLYMAAQEGHFNIVKLLLESGANPNTVGNNDTTPLFVACHRGRFDIVKWLLEKNANPNYRRHDGITALLRAAKNNHFDIVKLLLERGASPTAVKSDGTTLLFWAYEKGQLDIIKLLLEKGVDPNQTLDNGITPLLGAVLFGQDDVVKLLLSKKATQDAIVFHVNNLMNHAKITQCEDALSSVLGDNCKKFISHFTPLHAAIFFGHSHMVPLLLNHNDSSLYASHDLNIIDMAIAMKQWNALDKIREYLETKKTQTTQDRQLIRQITQKQKGIQQDHRLSHQSSSTDIKKRLHSFKESDESSEQNSTTKRIKK